MSRLEWMTKRRSWVYRVTISSAFALSCHVAVAYEICDDRLRGALGDANSCRDIPATNIGLGRDADQHVCMVRQEGPSGLDIAA